MLRLKTGIRLESLRLSLRKAIDVAARLGTDAVEINARNEIRPQELSRTAVRHLKKLLSDRDLGICCLSYPTRRSFFDMEDLDRRLEGTRQAMSSAFDLGARLVVGSPTTIPDPETETERFETLIAAMTEIGKHGQRVGTNFALSFLDAEDRIGALLEHLPPGVGVDFDPADLIINSLSAEQTLRSIASRVLQFRARDAVRDFSQGRGVVVQLGRGSTDLPQLLALLEENQFDGHMVMEATGDDPEISCAHSIEYLKSLF